jgi:hypothetical protein
MIGLKTFRVYSPGYEATHWGFDHSQCVDLETALAQPNKIAVLPVFYNRPTEFSYRPEFATLDVEKFDLVLFTDIEFRSQTELVAWIDLLYAEYCEFVKRNIYKAGATPADRWRAL